LTQITERITVEYTALCVASRGKSRLSFHSPGCAGAALCVFNLSDLDSLIVATSAGGDHAAADWQVDGVPGAGTSRRPHTETTHSEAGESCTWQVLAADGETSRSNTQQRRSILWRVLPVHL